MDDIIEIVDSDSNECTVPVTANSTGGLKRKAVDYLEYDEESSDTDSSDTNSSFYNSEPILVEDSETEPEFECDQWDTDCKVVELQISETLLGFHLMPTCANDPALLQSQKQEMLTPELRGDLVDNKFICDFQMSWKNCNKMEVGGVKIITEPFQLCVIENFLQDISIFNQIREEFNEIKWNQRNMDLYEFFQSRDLKDTNLEYISNIYQFLKDNVMAWVANLTGLELTHISATCSLYTDTDYLLVHDDQQEDRMVAFVLYFTGKENWKPDWGGALQLLSRDSQGQPLTPVKDIFPFHNQFVFFPVTNKSYHQVMEVANKDDYRMSINGWFHTSKPPVFDVPAFLPLERGLYGSSSIKKQDVDIDLNVWVTPIYLETRSIKQIQIHMEDDSEISLRGFFKEEPVKAVLEALNYEDIKWNKVGPPNRYSYEIIIEENLPLAVERFLKLFQSTNMFCLLSKYTDLELTCENASMRYEFQRWTPGCYSLLTDYDWREKKELDVILYLGCSRTSIVVGGQTQYVSTEDEVQNALITLEPEENNLNVIFRDTARITKYVSKQSACKCFYILVCSYRE